MDLSRDIFDKINKKEKGFFLSGSIYMDSALFINIAGNLDTENSNFFLNSIMEILNSSIYKFLILDLKELNYISSTGIGVLTTLISETKKQNKNLYFMNLNNKVFSIIELLGFTNFFIILKNKNEIDSIIKGGI